MLDDADVGDLARGGAVGRLVAPHRRDVVLEVEVLDEPGLALVDVDRAGVGLVVGAAGVDGADHAAGVGLDQLHGRAAGGADVGEVGGAAAVGPEPAARPPPQQAEVGELVDDLARGRPEERQVRLGERRLLRGRAQVRDPCTCGLDGVEDRRLDRRADQRLGVRDEVGVERVVLGDEHAEGVLRAAPGAARPAARTPRGCRGSRRSAPRRGR